MPGLCVTLICCKSWRTLQAVSYWCSWTLLERLMGVLTLSLPRQVSSVCCKVCAAETRPSSHRLASDMAPVSRRPIFWLRSLSPSIVKYRPAQGQERLRSQSTPHNFHWAASSPLQHWCSVYMGLPCHKGQAALSLEAMSCVQGSVISSVTRTQQLPKHQKDALLSGI